MAINLNVDKFGAQFSAFVEFASRQKDQNFIACIEGQKPGLGLAAPDGRPRNIAAKEWDGYAQFWRGKDSRTVNNEVRALFLRTILGVCGVKRVEDLPPGVRAVLKADDYDGKGHPLTVRRIRAVTEAVKSAADVSAPAAAFASGTSPAVGRLHDLVLTAPGVPAGAKPMDKAAAFAAKLSGIAAKEVVCSFTHMVCRTFVRNGVEDFDKDHDQFIRDRTGQMHVYVDGQGEISRDYETARDEIVRFVTGDRGATFANASASVRKQAGLLMSILTQYTASSVMTAFQTAIERPGLTYQFAGNTGGAADTPMDFTLSKTADGDIQITFGQSNGTAALVLSDENGTPRTYVFDTATSRCATGLEIVLPAGAFRQLAEADWTQFDFEAFEAEGQNGTIDDQFAQIPEPFRLDAKITASAHFELDAERQVRQNADPNAARNENLQA